MGRGKNTLIAVLALALLPSCAAGCGTGWLSFLGELASSGMQGVTEEPAPQPLTGYYQATSIFYSRYGWVDPSALLVAWLDDAMMPRSGLDPGPVNRDFIFFDQDGMAALMLTYRPAENTVYYEDADQNFFFGHIPERVADGWLYHVEQEQPGDPFTMQFTLDLLAHDFVEGLGHSMTIQFDVTLILNADVPADPNSGRPLLPAGSTATWTFYEESFIQSCESPFVLFPDAAVAPEPAQQ